MSFRMSKDLASSIATQILKKRATAIEKLQKQYDKRVTEEYEKQIPLAVRKTFKLFPGYFRTTKSVTVYGAGFAEKYYQSLTHNLPEHHSERNLKLDADAASEVKAMFDQIEDLKKEKKAMRTEIENSLIALNSFSRIQKELPEVVKYLPKSTSQALMIDLTKVRETIKIA